MKEQANNIPSGPLSGKLANEDRQGIPTVIRRRDADLPAIEKLHQQDIAATFRDRPRRLQATTGVATCGPGRVREALPAGHRRALSRDAVALTDYWTDDAVRLGRAGTASGGPVRSQSASSLSGAHPPGRDAESKTKPGRDDVGRPRPQPTTAHGYGDARRGSSISNSADYRLRSEYELLEGL